MTDPAAPAPPPVPSHRQRAALLISNIVYLLICFGGSLNVYPLGADHQRLSLHFNLPFPTQLLVFAEWWCFGTTLWPWHMVNLILLWLCMNALFFLTRWSIGGMWWLGSLAAVLLMAHPLKSAAALQLTGAVDLLPAVLALWALAAYASDTQRAAWWKKAIVLAGLTLPAAFFPAYRGLFVLPLLFECFVLPREKRRWWRALAGLPGFVLCVLHFGLELNGEYGVTLADRIAPLFLVVYPIGILPETVLRLQDGVGLFWFLAGAGALLAIWTGRRVRHGVFWFGLLGAVAFRLAQGESWVDLIHLGGGAAMMVPIALAALAVAALSHQVMQHPKWPRYVVALTTVLCLVFMGLQIRSVLAWREAGRQVAAFQVVAAEVATAHPTRLLRPEPDYVYYRDAPMSFSSTIMYRTPFYSDPSHNEFSVVSGTAVLWNPDNPAEPIPYVPGFIKPRQWPIEVQEMEEPSGIVLIPFSPSLAEDEE